MQVYHTGSGGEAIVLTKEGDLKLVNQSHGADIVFKTEDSGGAVVTPLTLDSAGAATFAGDIEVENSANGLILESPDGTRYRVTVANGGTLSVAAV